MTNENSTRQGEQRRGQQGDTHAGQIQQDRGLQKQDLNPAEQNQGEQDRAQQRADTNPQQQDEQDAFFENNRGGADPTGGHVIREGRGPGENIAPRPGEGVVEGGQDMGQCLEEGQPASMGQPAEIPPRARAPSRS